MATETIALHQHFYSSVPEGRGLSEGRTRGLQTIGCSSAIDNWRSLENHCEYYQPSEQYAYDSSGARSGQAPPLPVNWGWMELDARWVCLHRIADAGLDDIKREGNFLVHNLVVGRQDLEAVDWDVLSLLRWVEAESPVRFSRGPKFPDGGGFPINGDQVFRRYAGAGSPDQRFANLKAIPPLLAPVSRIRELRKLADESFAEGLLRPAIQALGPRGLRDLIAAALAPPDQRRPILIYGLKNSGAESGMERKLCDLLFAILPFSNRRRFPFSTYDHDASLTRGDDGEPHRHRRLIMTTARNDVRPSWFESSHWVINVDEPEPIELEPSPLAKTCIQWLSGGGDSPKKWLRFRSYADRFDFPDDEMESLDRARQWLAWASVASSASPPPAPRPEDYPLYAFMADRSRGRDASIADFGRLLIGHLREEPAHPSPPALAEFARGHIKAVAARRSEADARDIAGLARLWNHALTCKRFDACAALIKGLAADDRLQTLREPCRREFLASLPSRWKRWVLSDFQDFWIAIAASWSDPARKSAIQPMISGLAAHALTYLKESGIERLPTIGLDDERFLLPVCVEAPFGEARDLLWRMRLLRDETTASRFQTRLVTERLDPAMAEQLAHEGPELILRLYPTIKELAAREPRLPDALRRSLTDPAVAARYWTLELSEHDSAIELGIRRILQDQNDPRSPWREDWARRYVREGSAILTGRIADTADGAGLGSLLCKPEMFAETQFLLASRAIESLSGDPAVYDAAAGHLSGLIARLAELDRQDPALRPAFVQSLKRALQDRPRAVERAIFLGQVAAAIAESGPDRRTAIETAREVMLKEAKLDPAEADWHFTRLSCAFAHQGMPILELERQAAADFLTLHPGHAVPEAALVDSAPAPPTFRQWFPQRIEDQVWHLLMDRIVNEGDPGELTAWFEPKRRAVLSMIDAKGWGTTLGERLANRLGKLDGGPARIDSLLALNPPEEIARELQVRLLDQSRIALIQFDPEALGDLSQAEFAKLYHLTGPLRRVADVLTREEVERAWLLFGAELPKLTPGSAARLWFHNVLEFAVVAAERHALDLSDLFGQDFFASLARSQRNRADLFEILANLCESLFLNEKGESRQHREAERVLAAARGSEISAWLGSGRQKRQPFFEALNQCIDEPGPRDRLERIAFARGQTASILLAPTLKADESAIQAVAVCCCKLGALSLIESQSEGENDFQRALAGLRAVAKSDREWEARLAAKATAGYLLVREQGKTRCMERAVRARDCGFINVMRDEVKISRMRDRVSWLDDLREKIKETLVKYGKMPESEASAAAKTLAPPFSTFTLWRG